MPAAMMMIVGSKLDTGKFLDKVKRLPSGEQAAFVKQGLKAPAKKKSKPKKVVPKTYGFADPPVFAVSDLYAPLEVVKQAWSRASAKDRLRIKAWVSEQETPVDDGGGDA